MDGSWWSVLTKRGPLEKGIGNHFSILILRTHEPYEKAKNITLKDELPRLVDVQYATREEWRNNSKKNEEMEPKQKHPFVDVTADGSKVQCYTQCASKFGKLSSGHRTGRGLFSFQSQRKAMPKNV